MIPTPVLSGNKTYVGQPTRATPNDIYDKQI